MRKIAIRILSSPPSPKATDMKSKVRKEPGKSRTAKPNNVIDLFIGMAEWTGQGANKLAR